MFDNTWSWTSPRQSTLGFFFSLVHWNLHANISFKLLLHTEVFFCGEKLTSVSFEARSINLSQPSNRKSWHWRTCCSFSSVVCLLSVLYWLYSCIYLYHFTWIFGFFFLCCDFACLIACIAFTSYCWSYCLFVFCLLVLTHLRLSFLLFGFAVECLFCNIVSLCFLLLHVHQSTL